MEDQKEVWKTYPDYPFVEVSNLGRVMTIDHWVTYKDGRKGLYRGHVLNQWILPNGYMQVQVSMNGKRVHLYVHRLVATCFIPNPLGLPEVNHIDNDRANNSASNLEWCTKEYNEAYKKNFGTTQAEVLGRVLGRSVIAVNPETSEIFRFKTLSEAARQLDVSKGNICSVLKGRYTQTSGYWFCYADENAVEKIRAKFGDKVAEKVEKLIS